MAEQGFLQKPLNSFWVRIIFQTAYQGASLRSVLAISIAKAKSVSVDSIGVKMI